MQIEKEKTGDEETRNEVTDKRLEQIATEGRGNSSGSTLPPTGVFYSHSIPKMGEGPLHDVRRKAQWQNGDFLDKAVVRKSFFLPQQISLGIAVKPILIEKNLAEEGRENEVQRDGLSPRLVSASDTASASAGLENSDSSSRGNRGKEIEPLFLLGGAKSPSYGC